MTSTGRLRRSRDRPAPGRLLVDCSSWRGLCRLRIGRGTRSGAPPVLDSGFDRHRRYRRVGRPVRRRPRHRRPRQSSLIAPERRDLIIGSPGEDDGASLAAGTVHVLYSDADGPNAAGSQQLFRRAARTRTPGSARFSWALVSVATLPRTWSSRRRGPSILRLRARARSISTWALPAEPSSLRATPPGGRRATGAPVPPPNPPTSGSLSSSATSTAMAAATSASAFHAGAPSSRASDSAQSPFSSASRCSFPTASRPVRRRAGRTRLPERRRSDPGARRTGRYPGSGSPRWGYDPPMNRSPGGFSRSGPSMALALLAALGSRRPDVRLRAAVVVGAVTAPPGAQAPLAAGDAVVRWRLAGATPARSGELAHWGELDLLPFVESPRGTLEIELVRGGIAAARDAATGGLGVQGAPGDSERRADRLRRRPRREGLDRDRGRGRAPPRRRVRRRAELGLGALRRRLWQALRLARRRTRRSRAAIAAAPPSTAADLERLNGDALRRLNRFAEAEAAYRRALPIWNGIEPAGLGASLALGALGNLRAAQYEVAEANRLLPRGRADPRAPGARQLAPRQRAQQPRHDRRPAQRSRGRRGVPPRGARDRRGGAGRCRAHSSPISASSRGCAATSSASQMYTRRSLELYRRAGNSREVANKLVHPRQPPRRRRPARRGARRLRRGARHPRRQRARSRGAGSEQAEPRQGLSAEGGLCGGRRRSRSGPRAPRLRRAAHRARSPGDFAARRAGARPRRPRRGRPLRRDHPRGARTDPARQQPRGAGGFRAGGDPRPPGADGGGRDALPALDPPARAPAAASRRRRPRTRRLPQQVRRDLPQLRGVPAPARQDRRRLRALRALARPGAAGAPAAARSRLHRRAISRRRSHDRRSAILLEIDRAYLALAKVPENDADARAKPSASHSNRCTPSASS